MPKKLGRSVMASAAAAILVAILLVVPSAAQANTSGPKASPGSSAQVAATDWSKVKDIKEIAPGVFTAQSASQWWCPYGAVCFYYQHDGWGSVCYSYSSVPNADCGSRWSYFNNGAPCSGCDHVYVYSAPNYNPAYFVKCLHYGWTEGRGNFSSLVYVRSFYWGGEC